MTKRAPKLSITADRHYCRLHTGCPYLFGQSQLRPGTIRLGVVISNLLWWHLVQWQQIIDMSILNNPVTNWLPQYEAIHVGFAWNESVQDNFWLLHVTDMDHEPYKKGDNPWVETLLDRTCLRWQSKFRLFSVCWVYICGQLKTQILQ